MMNVTWLRPGKMIAFITCVETDDIIYTKNSRIINVTEDLSSILALTFLFLANDSRTLKGFDYNKSYIR